MKSKLPHILFSIFGAILVLWHLLGRGYVLALDMVFGPRVYLGITEGTLINTLPFKYVIHFFTELTNGWIAQKILLCVIFFLLFYLPLRYFNLIFKFKETYGAEYVASILFAVNPFVYERFLAGQWAVVFGYVLFLPVMAYLIEFVREYTTKNAIKLGVSIILLGLISTHFLMIALVIVCVSSLGAVIYYKGARGLIMRLGILAVSLVCASSYWLVPAFIGDTGTPLENFDAGHWEVFMTSHNDMFGGVIGNVISLHGFWGEEYPWGDAFVFPRDHHVYFVVTFALLAALILIGVYAGIRNRERRGVMLVIVGGIVVSAIFSIGIAEGIFKDFNMWLFEHVSMWRGFRDSQKWSGVIALGYALCAGVGVQWVLSKVWREKCKRMLLGLLILIPVLYTPYMFLGFDGQLKTSQYPESWVEANEVLKGEENCKAVFLPWHQYYDLKLNHSMLTANPSQRFFECQILGSKNMGMGDIPSQGGSGREYYDIEDAVISNEGDVERTIGVFKQYDISHIIFTDDFVEEDEYLYPFLNSSILEKVFNKEGIAIYRIL